MKTKQTLLAALLLVGLLTSAGAVNAAGPYQTLWTLSDEFGTPYEYPMDAPTGARILAYDGVNPEPMQAQLGAGLFWDGTSIVPTGITFDAIDGLETALDGKANVSHTHTSSDITNFNAAVDARITAATSSSATFASAASSTRSLNTAFLPSASSTMFVNYSVDISTTVSLSGGAVGTVFLEYADNSGFTTNVREVGRFVNGQTGTLVVGLTLNQTNTAQLSGMIPPNKYVRIRTENTTGTPTFTFRSGQEVRLPMQ